MNNKNVDDYLTEGMYGKRRPKEHERTQFLGTLRERIVLALSVGQVMSDSGINKLEEVIKENPNAKLLINGHVPYRFLKEEKALANKYNIAYTTIANNEEETDIGAVLTYDYAIDKEDIFFNEEQNEATNQDKKQSKNEGFLGKLKRRFGL